ncbi:MAG TPA: hypothetical protein VK540_32825 [Polyangiaceae bacterium]|jgi:hypothetical protein|nr:hypothetical protein [Polyangiaceae bacterium]
MHRMIMGSVVVLLGVTGCRNTEPPARNPETPPVPSTSSTPPTPATPPAAAVTGEEKELPLPMRAKSENRLHEAGPIHKGLGGR